MNTGFHISIATHTILIAFLLFGGLFTRDRLPPVSVADVTVISAEEFAALSNATAPDLATEAAQPVPPATQPPPPRPQPETPPERAEPPAAEPAQEPEAAPEVPELQPVPPAEVTDTAPSIAPPGDGLDASALPEDSAPPPADRVAPEVAPPPPLEAETAPDATPEVATDAPGEIVEERTTATAPEEATTEIVTEAEEERDLAPTSSPRPTARPAPPVQTAETETPAETPTAREPAPETATAAEADTPPAPVPDDDLIAAAVADAVSQAQGETAPSGPPLTGSERDAFRLSVQRCWVVDVGSEAASVTVVVGMTMNRDGTVADGSLRLLEGSGGSDSAVQTAFQVARRAILRCGASGFDLPVEKYDQWRNIEMTFNPEGMRLR